MKLKIILWMGIAFFAIHPGFSQHVNVQLSFPVTAIHPPGPAPFKGAVWIGPEWRWQRGAYVCVPGYWSRPKRKHKNWKNGYWRRTGRGYIWISGCWR